MGSFVSPTKLSQPTLSLLGRSGIRTKGPLPTDSQLSTMLAIAFQASLEVEEGRFSQFALVFGGDSVDSNEHFKFTEFADPRELSVGELRKLAPATDEQSTAIVVGKGQTDLEIRGILFVGGRLSRMKRGLAQSSTTLALLHIRVTGLGCLVVEHGPYELAAYRRGSVSINDAPLQMMSPILDIVTGGITRTRKGRWVLPRRPWDFICRLTDAVAGHQHGGTILICRRKPKVIDFKFALTSPADVLCEAIESHWSNQKRVASRDRDAIRNARVVENLQDAIEHVATLAAVDGALVMDSRLRVVGFGGVIRGGLRPVVKKPTRDRNAWESADMSSVGTRHQSAARFVARNRFAIGIVVSQDGGISLFGRNPHGDVAWWQLSAIFMAFHPAVPTGP